MTETEQNFEMRAGETIILDVDVDDRNGDSFDVSNYSVTFELCNYAGAEPLFTYTESDSNLSVGTPEIYMVRIELNSSDTENLGGVNSGDSYFYQITIDDGPDDVSTITEGHITIRP